MNAPTSPAVAEQSHPVEAKVSKLVEQESLKPTTHTENGSERIRSSVARLASSSVSELEGLASELQRMQEFLKSEVGRVQVKSRAYWPESTSSSKPLHLGKARRTR